MTPVEVAQWVANSYEPEEGYIIGFVNDRSGPESGIYQGLFVKMGSPNPVVSPMGIIGGSLEDAHVFPTYPAAAEAAASWVHTRKPGTRIIRVRKQPPIEIFEDWPVGVLDALAEATDGD